MSSKKNKKISKIEKVAKFKKSNYETKDYGTEKYFTCF